MEASTPDVKLAATGYRIDLLRRFVCASSSHSEGARGGSCVVLENRRTRSLASAVFVARSSLVPRLFHARGQRK